MVLVVLKSSGCHVYQTMTLVTSWGNFGVLCKEHQALKRREIQFSKTGFETRESLYIFGNKIKLSIFKLGRFKLLFLHFTRFQFSYYVKFKFIKSHGNNIKV